MTRPAADDRERWERIESLFDAVHELPAAERADGLLRECDDPAIREEVASLLAEEGSVPPIVDSVAVRALGIPDEVSRVGKRVGAYLLVRRIGALGGRQIVYGGEQRLDALPAFPVVIHRFRHVKYAWSSPPVPAQ